MELTAILVILLILLALLAAYYRWRYIQHKKLFEGKDFDYRSLYVKHGKHWEQFAPFLKEFPGNKENFRFIGMPIDGIIFDDDEIKFVEIKTGNSKLSEKQQRVKQLVEKKKVGWRELRI